MLANNTIREQARRNNVPLWKVADSLGISEATFFRWLRKPLDGEKQTNILAVIDKLTTEAKEEAYHVSSENENRRRCAPAAASG